jgi:hypothetical protein
MFTRSPQPFPCFCAGGATVSASHTGGKAVEFRGAVQSTPPLRSLTMGSPPGEGFVDEMHVQEITRKMQHGSFVDKGVLVSPPFWTLNGQTK